MKLPTDYRHMFSAFTYEVDRIRGIAELDRVEYLNDTAELSNYLDGVLKVLEDLHTRFRDIHEEFEACDLGCNLLLTKFILEGDRVNLKPVIFHFDNGIVDDAVNAVIEFVTELDDLLSLSYGLGGHEHTGEYGSFRIVVMGHYFLDDIFAVSVHVKPLRL